ncbi:MAG: preprotein translocase subunit SecE [Clostridiaceae bacterium]|jgi:preprotein translocase subunit SecE|nr:preprotein translocase subunit SecE [Clostridiaceae bacterium]
MADENKSLDTQKNSAEKPKKQQKQGNFFSRAGKGISKWFRELVSEGKKVVWPTWKQVVNNTLVVIGCILVVGVFVWALDIAFATIRDLLVSIL